MPARVGVGTPLIRTRRVGLLERNDPRRTCLGLEPLRFSPKGSLRTCPARDRLVIHSRGWGIMRRIERVLVSKVMLGTIATAVLALALPGLAGADVLYSAPKAKICLEGTSKIRIGIWYQAYSGGPRWFRIRIRHGGERVYTKNGHATTTWRYYGFDPPAISTWAGRYKTVIRAAGWRQVRWTRVVICGD
jgi:hypothetical protein